MSVTNLSIRRQKVQHIKLPKFFLNKPFRIRSVTKDKSENIQSVVIKKNSQTQKQLFASNQKMRSNSLKSTRSKRSATRKSQTGNMSSDEQLFEAKSCKNNSKITRLNSKEKLQIQHKKNMETLYHIANIMDPNRLMNLRKKSDHSHQQNSVKNGKPKNLKNHYRLNQYIFEGRQNRNKKQQRSQLKQADEYWRKVNESLILAPCKTEQIVEVSKDLRQIYQNFVTE